MRVTIDNLDGQSAQDYAPQLDSARPLRIERKLNEPTSCSFTVNCSEGALAAPRRGARVMVESDDGVLLFSGYLAMEPAAEFAGMSTRGCVYRSVVSAVSDELLLDRQPLAARAGATGLTVDEQLGSLTARAGVGPLDMSGVAAMVQIGRFVARPGANWSENAGALAAMARTAYRALGGSLSLAPVGSTVHELSEEDGTLQVSALQAAAMKMLANDVTVCGGVEPAAYVTEIFQGDGTTVLFGLAQTPYFPAASESALLSDLFQTRAINPALWQTCDPGSHLSVSSAGLTLSGGSGLDGQTTMTALTPVEIGGSLVLEASGVRLSAGSDGFLCALYSGLVNASNCFAGFRVHGAGGVTTIVPVVQGEELGTPFQFDPTVLYTLRLRIHCREMQRVLESYYSSGDGGLKHFGGDFIAAGADLVMEIQPVVNGIPGVPVVLYDGAVANSPAVCTFVAVNSMNLLGSLRSITLTAGGCEWVKSVLPGENALTRRMGTTAQHADCIVERTGALRFYPGSVPQSGELIFVSYRTTNRAVARLADEQSIAVEQGSGGGTGVWQWVGSVSQPGARSSADCENAAAAVLNASSSRAAAWSGRYVACNPPVQGDIWPGDVLAVNCASRNLQAELVVRAVQVESRPSVPEVLQYSISFANDWAEELSLRLSSSVPKDVWMPQAANLPVLANLQQLAVTAVSATAIDVDAGVAPPAGGGFEVRRRDWAFGPGTDCDLVLRSPVQHFTIPREAPMERYYIRMFDASEVPVYSRFSNAVVVNVPV